jgi:mannose-6-phosphate isomerase-like protein (cupin superfamily)
MIAAAFVMACPIPLCRVSEAQTYGDKVDLYFGDWHNAPVHTVFGSLHVQDVLSPGNALTPGTKGAVLSKVNSFRHASLPSRTATQAIKLKGLQHILYITAGTGEIEPENGSPIPVQRGIATLLPEGTHYRVRNTGGSALEFYLIEEATPTGFRGALSPQVRDDNKLPISTTRQEWSYIVKPLFVGSDGLAVLSAVSTVELDALTIGRPELAPPGAETVWTTLEGTPVAFIANELRRQPVGMAFLEVPDAKTPHSEFNPDENAPARFLVFSSTPGH